MASEKDFKDLPTSAEPPMDSGAPQNVPLGGQPTRPSVTHEEHKEMTAAEHALCDPIWDKIIKAFDKALEECPAVTPGEKGGRSRGAMEIRNHISVWKSQALHLKAGL